MPQAIGWLVVQRNLTESVRVADTPEVWLTTTFSTPSQHIVGMDIADSPDSSLRGAVTRAVKKPARGAPRQIPAVVLTPAELVASVRQALREVGVVASVHEVVTPDWAEDVLTELTAHLAGRPQLAPPPTPEQWALLYQQTAAYVRAAPWERRADDVHLQLEVRVGSRRTECVAIVTGNAGTSRGLVLCSGSAVPPALLSDDPETLPPDGTCHLALGPAREAPPELHERAQRYGWPASLDDAPLFVMVGPEGPQEIGCDEAEAMTVALAATIDHDRQGAGFGIQVAGEITLAGGRRGRYRARLQTNEPLPLPPGLQLLSGEIRFDWLPRTTFIGLGGLPWEALPAVRDRAALHLWPPQARPAVGERLPLLILGMAAVQGRRVARLLHDAHPEGVALVEAGDRVVAMIITGAGLFGVTSLDAAADTAVARFRQGVVATDGWHAIVVSTREFQVGDPIYGFFECVLTSALGAATPRRRGRGGKRQRDGNPARRVGAP